MAVALEAVLKAAPIPAREVLAVVGLDQILVGRETLVVMTLLRVMLAAPVAIKVVAVEEVLVQLELVRLVLVV